ncbi:MAG: GGDEF domain-containing protein, partial [Acholeplasmataceae bacterium]|nr:GGDEF domain-containing protein [Acholeplasmataceae bacterium]
STKYGIDYVKDIILDSACHVTFYFDLLDSSRFIYIISGDQKKIGLPDQMHLSFDTLFDLVEPDNKLAEVEGKNNFIETLKEKLMRIDKELFLYIPVKKNGTHIWLYVSFHVISEIYNIHKLILGRVIRVLNDTPDEIIYYQKTYQDSLTRLFTRETLKKHISYLKSTENSYGLYIDIDGFKRINDHYGHHHGDEFLVQIANHFISNWEKNVLYYRLGGDEFFVYVKDHSFEEVSSRAKKIIRDIENLTVEGKSLGISCSIGIVKMTEELRDYHLLLDLGDQTMYKAKKNGKGQIAFHEMI